MKKVLKLFDEIINIVVRNYDIINHETALYNVVRCVKSIFTDPKTFEYIFQKYYSYDRSPYITAYSHFMNCLYSGYEFDETVEIISEGIIIRKLNEKRGVLVY